MSNDVGLKIKKLREEQGVTQDYLAACLDITQSNYGRLEKDDSRLNVPKLLKISEILKVSVGYLLGEKTTKVIQQSHNETANAYNSENTIINSDKSHIDSLKSEISFLRSQLDKSK